MPYAEPGPGATEYLLAAHRIQEAALSGADEPRSSLKPVGLDMDLCDDPGLERISQFHRYVVGLEDLVARADNIKSTLGIFFSYV